MSRCRQSTSSCPPPASERDRSCLIGALLEDLDAREPGVALLQIRDADPPKRRVGADLHP